MTGGAPRVAVIGGGLAGTAAALRSADRGADVTLLEARPRLGGLAGSFRRGDLTVDTGQHVFLRCCTSYRALLDRLGARGQVSVQDRLDIPVLSPGARPARLRRSALPAPLHLARALSTYRPLGPAERARAARAALALRAVDPLDPAVDRRSFGGWLRTHGQSPRAIEALWDLVGIATLNAHADDASLALAAVVFRDGLLTDPAAGDIGHARVPLGRLHDDAARRALDAAGVRTRTGVRVRTVEHGTARTWRLGYRGTNEERNLDVDRIVCAVPPGAASRMLPPEAVDLPPGWADRLGHTPIVNVHVVYDRRVLDEPFAAAVDSPVQWVFDRTDASGAARVHPRGAQYLAVSLSAAHDLVGMPVAELAGRFLPALAALLPAARSAVVLDFFVTREPHATFRSAPGSAALRPPSRTRLPGLTLAGAWTATGWPATMEGAVRSGETAADAALDVPATTTGAAA